MAHRFMTLLATLFIALATVSPSFAGNTLYVAFGCMNVDGTDSKYNVTFQADKDGATTATLATPLGTYPFMYGGSFWIPAGGAFRDDHSDLLWSDFATIIAGNWVLIWDEGLVTETVAHIGFGSLVDSDYAPIPIITYPENGAVYLSGVSRVEWNYGALDPCVAPVGDVRVAVSGIRYWEFFGPLGCDVTSVDLTILSSESDHRVMVDNVINQHATADGIGGLITGDSWILENEYWLFLDSRAQLEFTGQVVEIEELNFGSLKAIFR